jgi:hypothetical protein
MPYRVDTHGSVHHDVLAEMTSKMQLCRIIYCPLTAPVGIMGVLALCASTPMIPVGSDIRE